MNYVNPVKTVNIVTNNKKNKHMNTFCGVQYSVIQWNLCITTTSKIKCITFDLFSNVF